MLTRRELMKRGALGGAGLIASRALLTGPALGDTPVAKSLKLELLRRRAKTDAERLPVPAPPGPTFSRAGR